MFIQYSRYVYSILGWKPSFAFKLNFAFKWQSLTQTKNILIVLPRPPIQVWDKLIKGFMIRQNKDLHVDSYIFFNFKEHEPLKRGASLILTMQPSNLYLPLLAFFLAWKVLNSDNFHRWRRNAHSASHFIEKSHAFYNRQSCLWHPCESDMPCHEESLKKLCPQDYRTLGAPQSIKIFFSICLFSSWKLLHLYNKTRHSYLYICCV